MVRLLRWTGRLSILCGIAIFMCIAIGRGQPSTLGAFLSNSACVQICWQGIIPGHTSAAEALAILRRLPYVDPHSIRALSTLIQWQWTPDFAWSRSTTAGFQNHSDVAHGVVQSVGLDVAFSAGNLISLFGSPRQLTLSLDYAVGNRCPYGLNLLYSTFTMRYVVIADCMGDFPGLTLNTADGRYLLTTGNAVTDNESGVTLHRFAWGGFKRMSRYLMDH